MRSDHVEMSVIVWSSVLDVEAFLGRITDIATCLPDIESATLTDAAACFSGDASVTQLRSTLTVGAGPAGLVGSVGRQGAALVNSKFLRELARRIETGRVAAAVESSDAARLSAPERPRCGTNGPSHIPAQPASLST